MFRTNFQPRRLSSFSLGLALAVVLTSICALVQAQGDRKGGRVEKVPEGAIVEGKKITLKAGYEFVSLSESKMAIKRKRTNNVTGSFSCDCSGAGGGGSCRLESNGTDASCSGNICCKLTIVVTGPGRSAR